MKNCFRKYKTYFVFIFFFSSSIYAVEFHGFFKTIYNPQKRYVYKKESSLENDIIIPELNYYADTIPDPFQGYYIKKFVREYTDDSEREYRVVHNLSQLIRFNILDLGGEKGSFYIDARLKSADDENQPDHSLRQIYYKYTDFLKVIKEAKAGRILSTRAAGMVNYDGLSLQIKLKNFYFFSYGGLLLDNDYLQTEEEKCMTYPVKNTCFGGTNFENETYKNKWEATDVRNTGSKEIKGDTIAGSSLGYKGNKLKFEIDYQKKTDNLRVTEELGGLNLLILPLSNLDIYANAKGDIIHNYIFSGIGGISWFKNNWKYNPEYEYYKPHFKDGSFWENFHTFARSSARMSIFRYQGRKLIISLMVGKIYFIDDNSKSENLTTETVRDPVTGQITGSANKTPQEIPLYFFKILGNPYTLNPITGQIDPIESRPMSPFEILVYNEYVKQQAPEDGMEGDIGFKYSTNFSLRWGMTVSTIQGPEGIVNRIAGKFTYPWKKFHFTSTVGRAYFEDIESKSGNETANYITLSSRFRLNTSIQFELGGEYYSDSVYKKDIRGRLGFQYAF
ncbi:MAG: hypothetical protein OEZ34_15670 [Spirochaetia bacterium]|nr:hypothetical protein [Spirochaetia bacterium]